MSCVFCAIVAGEAPAIRIYEDDGYLAILDIRPFTRGHTLVIPKKHTVDLTDTPPETLADMVAIGQRIAKAARATELADATNVGINDGSAAFQSVFHVHLHVLPRRNGDKLSVAKGMLLRRDPDREATGKILRDALARDRRRAVILGACLFRPGLSKVCCRECCGFTTPSIRKRTAGSDIGRWGYPACCCTPSAPRPA